jgi:hypothetical protein
MDTRTKERMGHLLPGMIADPEAQEKRRVLSWPGSPYRAAPSPLSSPVLAVMR